MTKIYVHQRCLFVLLAINLAMAVVDPWPHVYSGSHFDELVSAANGTALYSVALFIYKPECPAKVSRSVSITYMTNVCSNWPTENY